MSDTLNYEADAEVDRAEAIYRTAAVRDRRQRVRDRLGLETGESVLSIGCGPGFETAEITDVVGPTGHVHDVDRRLTLSRVVGPV